VTTDTDRRILLVDDQKFVGIALGRLLAGEPDLELHCCHVAADALAAAEQLVPAVILQDCVLPDVDGFTLVQQFRGSAVTARTAIIMLSGNDDPAQRQRALAAGANDFLVKLPPKDELVTCIRRHLGANGDAEINSPVPAAGDPKTLDRDIITVLRGGSPEANTDLVARLLTQFVDEATSLAAKVQAAVRADDVGLLKMASHSLRGASTTIGAQRLAMVSAQIERCADGGNATIDRALLAAVDAELRAVSRACAEECGGLLAGGAEA
jgi:DNA-binding response OmpR family regulator